MQNNKINKGLIVGIIILLGVILAPSINGSNYVVHESDQQQILDSTSDRCFIIGKITNATFGMYIKPPLGRKIGISLYYLISGFEVFSEGWIYSIGRNGIQTWEGMLKGNLSVSYRIINNYPNLGGGWYEVYDGIDGFKGIKFFSKDTSETFFMGFARQVKIDEIK